MEDNKTKIKIKAALSLLFKIITIGTFMWALTHYVLCLHVNHEYNMYPAVHDGDLCISYRLSHYSAGNMVLYRANGITRIGRIVSPEGHTINITNQGVLIDDSLQAEKVVYPTTEKGTTIPLPYEVEEGRYFLMNDYREDVSDSRTLGTIQKEDLLGTVVLVIRRRDF